jgi:hypothetical protein
VRVRFLSPGEILANKAGLGSPVIIKAGGGRDEIKFHTDLLPDDAGSGGTPISFRVFAGGGDDEIDVLETEPGAAVLLPPGDGLDSVIVNSDGTGSAQVEFEQTQRLVTLTVADRGTARFAATLGNVLTTQALSIGALGAFDLAANAMIVDYTGSSPLSLVRAALTSGYNGGGWNGSGINSSAAATTPGRAIGYAEASALFSSFPAMFLGQTVDDTAVLLRYTRSGDADLSGSVNLNDFNRLATNFGGTNAVWSQGNFNFDATTNLNDFNLLAANFGLSAASFGHDEELRDVLDLIC